jgi:hypothetical protein
VTYTPWLLAVLVCGVGWVIRGQKKIMSATDDLKAGQAALDNAVADVVTYLKNLAGTISGGVSAEDAAAITADLNAQAAALEAAIAPPAAAQTA